MSYKRVYAQSTGLSLSQTCPGESVVMLTDSLDMIVTVDRDVRNVKRGKHKL